LDTFKDLGVLLQILQSVGPVGLLVYIYWSDQRSIKRIQDEASQRFAAMKEMYESNVTLVKNYESISKALVDLVTLNTQHLTTVEQKIDSNQFCPFTRTKKTLREDMS
jgi:hypothetical protein